MEISTCFNPVRVKVNGHVRYVPCGKCDACRINHGFEWSKRLEDECKCWPYSAFITLTYDDKHVPRFELTKDNFLVNFKTQEIIDCSSISGSFLKSRLYIKRRKSLFACSKHDIQNFFKLLRYFISVLHLTSKDDHLNHSFRYDQIRYFCVSEYGETTLRPHYHIILWFQAHEISQCLDKMLSKAWPHGRFNWSFVQGNAPSYVASYVSCISCLPKIYQLKEIRPFLLCSKEPPIGSLSKTDSEIREIFDKSIVEILDNRVGEVRYVPVPRYIKNKIFPRCPRYCEISHYDRVFLYGISQFSGCNTFQDFVKWTWSQSWYKLPLLSTKGQEALSAVAHSGDCRFLPLLNLWRMSRRVLAQCDVWHVTLDYYVSQIEKFYDNVERLKLRKWYMFQDEYVRNGGRVSDLVSCDIDSVLSCLHRAHLADFNYLKNQFTYYDEEVKQTVIPSAFQLDKLKDYLARPTFYIPLSSDVLKLAGYSIDAYRLVNDSSYLEEFRWQNTISYKRLKSKYSNILRKSCKTKKKNDYLRAHPELVELSKFDLPF